MVLVMIEAPTRGLEKTLRRLLVVPQCQETRQSAGVAPAGIDALVRSAPELAIKSIARCKGGLFLQGLRLRGYFNTTPRQRFLWANGVPIKMARPGTSGMALGRLLRLGRTRHRGVDRARHRRRVFRLSMPREGVRLVANPSLLQQISLMPMLDFCRPSRRR